MWDALTWKVEVLFSKVNFIVVGVIIAVVFYAGSPFLLPLVLGARGYLIALAIQWLGIAVFSAGITAVGIFIFRYRKLATAWRWVGLGAAVFCGMLFLFALVEGVGSTGDSFLPFSYRDVTVVRTYYEHPQTSRGAMPETGGWHIVTSDGDDYRVRDGGDGGSVKTGDYRLELSRLKHLVMKATPRTQ